MIILDTHIWIWWVQGDARLPINAFDILDRQNPEEIGVSIISCWEAAMLHARGKLSLPCILDDWMTRALAFPGVNLLNLSPVIVMEACRLPGDFHRDPADRLLVATARLLNVTLLTVDGLILGYPHVKGLHPKDLI